MSGVQSPPERFYLRTEYRSSFFQVTQVPGESLLRGLENSLVILSPLTIKNLGVITRQFILDSTDLSSLFSTTRLGTETVLLFHFRYNVEFSLPSCRNS